MLTADPETSGKPVVSLNEAEHKLLPTATPQLQVSQAQPRPPSAPPRGAALEASSPSKLGGALRCPSGGRSVLEQRPPPWTCKSTPGESRWQQLPSPPANTSVDPEWKAAGREEARSPHTPAMPAPAPPPSLGQVLGGTWSRCTPWDCSPPRDLLHGPTRQHSQELPRRQEREALRE